MLEWNSLISLLAQADGNAPAREAQPMGPFIIYLTGGLVIFMVVQMFFGRSDSKEKAKRETFIGSLKKNDSIVTIGGIIGTVVSVSEDKTEVTIRVDDNSRLKMQASAIREVIAPKVKEAKENS